MKDMTKLDSTLKSRDMTLLTKFCLVRAMVFPIVMYGCENWMIMLSAKELMLVNCGVGEESWESIDCKEIQPVNPKGNQFWIFTGSLEDTKAETPILWPPDEKNWLIRKDPNSGKDWRQEKKGTTEDKMVDGITESVNMSLSKQGSLVCFSLWDCKELDMTEQLNWPDSPLCF